MFIVRGKLSVPCYDGPPVFKNFYPRCPDIYHRLDGNRKARKEATIVTVVDIIRYLRFLMNGSPNSVANKFPDNTETIAFHVVLDRP